MKRAPHDSPGIVRELFSGISLSECLFALIFVLMASAASVPFYVTGRERAAIARAYDSMRATATAIEAYQIDHGGYPACGTAVGVSRLYESQQIWQPTEQTRIPSGVPTINSFARRSSGAAKLVTFRIAGGMKASGGAPDLDTLTTPVAYLPRFASDPFMHTRGASFGYFPHGSGLGWILFSVGPDRDENDSTGPGDISPRVERLYNINTQFPYMWQPTRPLLDAGYDPTNGLWSNGDLYWLQGQR